jgi:hypothetical protein
MANLLSTIVSGRLSIGSNTATPYSTTAPDGIVFGGNEVGNAYRLYTDLENYGGNYTKLNIAWHTGIKIGAYYGYGGTRFYNNSPSSGTEIFSVGKGDNHVRVENNLYVGNTIYNNGNAVIHTGNIGSQSVNYANSSGITEFQSIPDARGNAYTPNAYTGQRVWWHFNNTDTVGGYGTYWHAIQTVSPWTSYDSSHRQQQIQWGGTDISFRYATSGTTWSSWFRFITDANIGSQSVNYATTAGSAPANGGNSSTVAGLSVHSGRNNEADKIVRTDSSGYIQAGWINTTSGDEGNGTPDKFYGSNDNYIRYYTRAYTQMYLGNTYHYTTARRQHTTDTNYWVGTMGWGQTDWNTVGQWGSGFVDSWSSPANKPPSGGHHVGVQAFHYRNGSTAYGWQIAQGEGTDWYLRRIWGGAWSGWYTMITSDNIASQSVNYAASAGAVAWGNVSSKPSNIMYYQSFTLDANTMDPNSTGFTYAVNAPFYGPVARFSTGGGYDLWIGGAYSGSGNAFYLRTRNGDAGTFNAWREIITSGNIASQSVSYADESGYSSSAGTTNNIEGLQFRNTGSNAGTNANTIDSNGITYYTSGVSNFSGNATDGALYSQRYSSSWQHQIAGDYRSGQIALRGKNNGTWTGWRTVLDSSNYSNWAIARSGDTIDNIIYFRTNQGDYLGSLDSAKLQVYSDNNQSAFMSFHRGGYYAVNFGLDRDNVMRIGGWSASANRWELDMSGNNTVAGSFRAPIFYDSADTTYYLDPNAGTSLKIAGGIVSTAANGAVLLKHENAEANAWIFRENAANWGLFWFNAGNQSGQTIGSYTTVGAELFGMNNAVTGYNPNSAWSGTDASTRASWMLSNYSGYLWTQGTQYSETDMRAPIFYDSNDTGYYGNFAGFSRMSEVGTTNQYVYNYDSIDSGRIHNDFGVVGKYVASRSAAADWPSFSFEHVYGNHSWGIMARFHIRQSAADRPSIQFSSGSSNTRWNIGYCFADDNFRISQNMGYRPDNSGVSDGWGTQRLLLDTSGNIYIGGLLQSSSSLRAPIFYDSDDTNFYVDPNATSRLVRAIFTATGNDYYLNLNGLTLTSITSGETIWRNLHSLRFTDVNDWDYNSWAGLKFINSTKQIVLGVAGNVFTANSPQTGTLLLDRISTVYVNDTSQVVIHSGSIGSQQVTSLNSSNYISRSGTSGDYNQDFRNTPAGSVRHQGDDASVANNPGGTWWFVDNYRHSNSSNFWGTQIAWGWEDNALRLAQRNVSSNNWSVWVEYLNSNNFTTWAQQKENQRLSTSNDVTFNTTTSPTILVNNHSDNTRGYRIHNTSGSSVSAMFTNSSNALVIAAGAFDQINLNKKVYVNGVALGVNVAPSATAGRIDASNDIVAYSSSDERLKHNITPIENAIDKVKSLTGVEFDWKPEYKHAHGYEGHDTGIIAQQVQEVIPSAVRTNDTGFLAVRYEKLIGLLVEGMKEQQAQIEELKAKLDGLTK